MYTKTLRACAFGLAASLLLTGTASATDAPSGKWRIECNGKATADGQMQFRITPHEGEALIVNAKISSGRGEMYIAKDILAAFKAELNSKGYRSQIVAGEKVVVKSKVGDPEFVLEFVEPNVPGTHVHVIRQ